MLEPNRLNPPRGYRLRAAAAVPPIHGERVFVSAEDFDATGILAGFDPCASSYWWMPELHAAEVGELAVGLAPALLGSPHATRRTSPRPHAAA